MAQNAMPRDVGAPGGDGLLAAAIAAPTAQHVGYECEIELEA